MDQHQKDNYLCDAKKNLDLTFDLLAKEKEKMKNSIKEIKKSLNEFNEDDKIVQIKLLDHYTKRLNELEQMMESPYFSKCNVNFDNAKDDIIHIGKFSLTEKQIYSWISPIARIRFEKPGDVYYVRPDKTKRNGVLEQKDQYMIVDGNVIYLSTESINSARELIYQDYFSNQKKDFALPEIVAQMEKAQDTVIRAHYKKSLLISGPAGSGKTTLAFHRIAYLLQSPDVSDKFNPNKILVLVQDIGTKKYFSQLLPDLGIKSVVIQTFQEWAINVLELKNYIYQYRIGTNEEEKDYYEYCKLNALKNLKRIKYNKNIFTVLKEVYKDFDKKYLELLDYQEKHKLLDRIDLTILVKLFKDINKGITILQEFYQMKKNGSAEKKIGRFSVSYDLIIFDEFQNYLPWQIKLLRGCLNKDNEAVMYVGDMNQQTQLGTVQSWSDINDILDDDRKVVLDKVYRNTKQILKYIKKLGYSIDIPEDLKGGEGVVEKTFENVVQEIKFVKDNLNKKVTVGILAKNKEYLKDYENVFKEEKNIHVLCIDEVQGVEFDTVFLVGINREDINRTDMIELLDLKQEKQKVDRDLLYVALTRAMNNLFVLGKHKLSDIM